MESVGLRRAWGIISQGPDLDGGYPLHVWEPTTAASLLRPFCSIETINQETSSRHDVSVFKLKAWTTRPEFIPESRTLVVPESGDEEASFQPMRRALKYMVSVRVRRLLMRLPPDPPPPSPSPTLPSPQSSDEDSDDHAPKRLRRRCDLGQLSRRVTPPTADMTRGATGEGPGAFPVTAEEEAFISSPNGHLPQAAQGARNLLRVNSHRAACSNGWIRRSYCCVHGPAALGGEPTGNGEEHAFDPMRYEALCRLWPSSPRQGDAQVDRARTMVQPITNSGEEPESARNEEQTGPSLQLHLDLVDNEDSTGQTQPHPNSPSCVLEEAVTSHVASPTGDEEQIYPTVQAFIDTILGSTEIGQTVHLGHLLSRLDDEGKTTKPVPSAGGIVLQQREGMVLHLIERKRSSCVSSGSSQNMTACRMKLVMPMPNYLNIH